MTLLWVSSNSSHAIILFTFGLILKSYEPLIPPLLCWRGGGRDCRILWLHFCREVRLPCFNKCPDYDTKQSNGEVPVMLELRGMWSNPSFPLLPAPFWPGVITLDRVLYMIQIELNCVLMLNWTAWNRTVLTCKLCIYAKLNCLN